MGKIHKAWPSLVASLLVLPQGVIGDEGVGQEQARAVVSAIFDRLDCEFDGVIEPDEVDEHFAQVWLPADRDRSRFLSSNEYSRTHRSVPDQTGAALFRDADSNEDGQVVASEFRLHLQRMIKTLDLDHNGEITRKDAGLKTQSWRPKRVFAPVPRRFGKKDPLRARNEQDRREGIVSDAPDEGQ